MVKRQVETDLLMQQSQEPARMVAAALERSGAVAKEAPVGFLFF